MARAKLSTLSTTELQSEIKRRSRKLGALQRKRDKLEAQLREVQQEIDGLGGEVTADGRRRCPRNDQNLADALADLLKSKTLSVTEAAIEVQKAGYRTTSPNFRTIVNQTLLKDKRFRRVSRGKYTAKAAPGGKKKKKKRTSKKRPSRRA